MARGRCTRPTRTTGRRPSARARASSSPPKSTANPALPALVRPLLGEDTWVLALQNGLGNVEFHAAYAGAERVLGGLAFVCINRVAPGVIEKYIAGSVRVGEFSGPARARTRDLAARFTRAGVDCAAVDSLAEAQWRKLVWNVPFNGLAIAAGGVTTDVILARPEWRARAWALMLEVRAGAAALGLEIPGIIFAPANRSHRADGRLQAVEPD